MASYDRNRNGKRDGSGGGGRSGGGGTSLAVIPIAFIFYFIYALLLLATDTGLYVTVWHRSILANAQRSTRYNNRFVANTSYEDDEYDNATVDENEPLRTFDRQAARSYGSRYLHLENNYRDCAELRKAIIVPNTQTSRSLNMQQLLSDHTINYFRCVIANRFSTDTATKSVGNGGGG